MHRPFLALGFLLGGLAVAAGAFGAHALATRLTPGDLDTFETAVRYQALGATAIVLVGLAAARWPAPSWNLAGALLVAGTLIFSGTLYALVLTGARWLGAVTPLGGLLLIAGFGWAAWVALTRT